MTHIFVKRESEVDTAVEQSVVCHKMLYDVLY